MDRDLRAFQSMLTEAKKQLLVPPEAQFIKEYLFVHELVAEALDLLQGDRQMFLGYLIPVLQQHLKQHLNDR